MLEKDPGHPNFVTLQILLQKSTIMQYIMFSQDTGPTEIHTVNTLSKFVYQSKSLLCILCQDTFFITANRIPFKQLRYHIKPSTTEHFSPALYKNNTHLFIRKYRVLFEVRRNHQRGDSDKILPSALHTM